MRPVIGIVSNFDVEKDGYFCYKHYVHSIEKSGAMPVILPYARNEDVESILSLLDGLVLSGGGDFPTEMYGAPSHPAVQRMIPERDRFEFALARKALEGSMPILGICRGMQILNVVGGGTIYPHTVDELPSAIDHRDGTPMDQTVHAIRLEPNTHLWNACGKRSEPFRVNSFHHQAVHKIAPGFSASAWADDGVIEAIESIDRPFVVGVQWHPEWMYDSEPACRDLINTFTEACKTSTQKS